MMNDNVKQQGLDDFQAGKLDVFAGTIKAGGEGIDLTVSSTVVFMDRSWSPFRNRQAEDRLHRLGQKNAVEVVDMYATHTVDSKVRTTNINKWSVLKQMLGDT
jgi:SNF2 family DNA or RNA helicase